jgi:cephalosporin-C deacetylase-like acetyl esterase
MTLPRNIPGLCTAVAFLLPLGPLSPLAAQAPAPKPGDAMIEKYLAQEAAKLGEKVLDGAKTRAEWEARRPRLKQEYLDMLGLWPLPEKTPLNAKITGTVEGTGFVVEKLHFQSKPGLYVTGNLYRPTASGGRRPPGKLPAVLYVCGHSNRGRDGNKTAFQDHGMWFATNGYVCLVIDTLQLGEIPGVHHGTYGRPYLHLKAYGIKNRDVLENRWWWQALGYTPAGVECWNGIRGIDYLVSRPDVDAERIAVTGISGGGAATFWIAAADERVKCAVPVSGMSDLESYVTNKVINGHCDCMFLINTYQWEWTTIAALVAPRPLLFANSDNDRIFPMDGNRRIIDRLRKLYKMYDRPELVDEYVSKGGHDYRPDLRVAIFQWINKHIKNDTGPVKDAEFKFFPNEQLRVFPKDDDMPKDAINGKIDEMFVTPAAGKLPEEGKFAEWKQGMMKELRQKAFRPFPERIPHAELKREIDKLAKTRLMGTESGIEVFTMDISGRDPDKEKAQWVIVANPAENYAELGPRIATIGRNAHLLVPRGGRDNNPKSLIPDLSWTMKSPPNYVERAHALLGRTIDQGRVNDIIATARSLQEAGKELKVAGRGQAGILAAYAALLEPSITEVVVVDPPVSHREGPIFLNVLRVLDIPEALGMLAPRPLTLVNAKDRAFDRTAEIYKRAGAAEKFQRK